MLSIPISLYQSETPCFAGERASDSYLTEPCEPDSTTRRIRFGFQLTNKSCRTATDAGLKVFAPVGQTATQLCEKIEASHPFDLLEDELGNQIMVFRFDAFPPRATRTIAITAELKLSELPNPVPDGNIERFLAPEKLVESDSPEIRKTAERLSGADQMETAANIFEFVLKHVRFDGYSKGIRGALRALEDRKGDCSEHMCLFVALCRAAGIPARGVGGYVCSADRLLNPSGYHNWAQFYADGAWHMADPQGKRFLQSTDCIAMRIIDSFANENKTRFHRFEAIGESMETKMKIWR